MSNQRQVGVRPTTPDATADRKYVDDSVASKATDATVIHNTGNETITGVKTFTTGGVTANNFKMPAGAATGYILTSSADGTFTWTAPTSGGGGYDGGVL